MSFPRNKANQDGVSSTRQEMPRQVNLNRWPPEWEFMLLLLATRPRYLLTSMLTMHSVVTSQHRWSVHENRNQWSTPFLYFLSLPLCSFFHGFVFPFILTYVLITSPLFVVLQIPSNPFFSKLFVCSFIHPSIHPSIKLSSVHTSISYSSTLHLFIPSFSQSSLLFLDLTRNITQSTFLHSFSHSFIHFFSLLS